jgi:hypothetical protein
LNGLRLMTSVMRHFLWLILFLGGPSLRAAVVPPAFSDVPITSGFTSQVESATPVLEELASVEAASGVSALHRIAFGERRGQKVRRAGFRIEGERSKSTVFGLGWVQLPRRAKGSSRRSARTQSTGFLYGSSSAL